MILSATPPPSPGTTSTRRTWWTDGDTCKPSLGEPLSSHQRSTLPTTISSSRPRGYTISAMQTHSSSQACTPSTAPATWWTKASLSDSLPWWRTTAVHASRPLSAALPPHAGLPVRSWTGGRRVGYRRSDHGSTGPPDDLRDAYGRDSAAIPDSEPGRNSRPRSSARWIASPWQPALRSHRERWRPSILRVGSDQP